MQEAYDYSPDSVIIMGHSLGSHVSGFAGKSLNGSVGVIIGLDPAGPLFLEALPGSRLNATDAQYVQAIHTNAKMFGVDYNLADDDFWVNDGSVQPGCDNVFELIMCSHNRSFILMAESINDDNFYGVECDSYSDYLDGECANNTELRMGSLIYNTSSTGVFYLNTSSTYPYALGDIYGDYDE
ncbi:hypothetical protein GWI33_010561 [Rhynchophorus ferrugineus]|uniref:Lipase domain-containing protein n=1 Tax=Rhynchophorus ferrugineus TaxID=354439 RepID=A0A834MDY3_RHYFE|nr:hypothetical protein GWI33_010561 [Rhynchophorus ferrugineus]